MRRRLLVPVLLAASAAAALADRETAQFHAVRGDKSLAAKKWDEAEGHYRKALEEDASFLPARHGLAQALLGSGRSAPAVEELRGFVDAARGAGDLPPEWKALVGKAEKQLAALDLAGAALQKIVDGHVEALVGIGQRWLTKDPAVAERALLAALKARPGHERATQLLGKLEKAPSAGVALFDGKSLDGWSSPDERLWKVVDGALVADAPDGNFGIRSEQRFEGDYDVVFEARMLEQYAEDAAFGVAPCLETLESRYQLGPMRGKVNWSDHERGRDVRWIATVSPTQLKAPLDPKQWNTFEVRFRDGAAQAFVNGEEIGREALPQNRRGGFVGVLVQSCRIAIRKVQVVPR